MGLVEEDEELIGFSGTVMNVVFSGITSVISVEPMMCMKHTIFIRFFVEFKYLHLNLLTPIVVDLIDL